jgi:hypothetical protein
LWCGDTVLNEAFLVLFGITCVKDDSVANYFLALGWFQSMEHELF